MRSASHSLRHSPPQSIRSDFLRSFVSCAEPLRRGHVSRCSFAYHRVTWRGITVKLSFPSFRNPVKGISFSPRRRSRLSRPFTDACAHGSYSTTWIKHTSFFDAFLMAIIACILRNDGFVGPSWTAPNNHSGILKKPLLSAYSRTLLSICEKNSSSFWRFRLSLWFGKWTQPWQVASLWQQHPRTLPVAISLPRVQSPS